MNFSSLAKYIRAKTPLSRPLNKKTLSKGVLKAKSDKIPTLFTLTQSIAKTILRIFFFNALLAKRFQRGKMRLHRKSSSWCLKLTPIRRYQESFPDLTTNFLSSLALDSAKSFKIRFQNRKNTPSPPITRGKTPLRLHF